MRRCGRLQQFDINLSASRGDGNLQLFSVVVKSLPGYKPIYLERGRKRIAQASSLEKFLRYKPIYLARGRKQIVPELFVIIYVDINLSTSRGDENVNSADIDLDKALDINLFTSRGDGNTLPALSAVYTLGYKPIYLERGRKLFSDIFNFI